MSESYFNIRVEPHGSYEVFYLLNSTEAAGIGGAGSVGKDLASLMSWIIERVDQHGVNQADIKSHCEQDDWMRRYTVMPFKDLELLVDQLNETCPDVTFHLK